jgi:hypothetical protein
MPFANDDLFKLPEDSISVPLAVLANDTDFASIVSFTQPTNGDLSFVDGELRYTPELNFVGTTSFTYTAQNNADVQNTALVELEVIRSHEQPQSTLDSRIAPEISPSGLELVVSKYARLPGTPRINSFDTVGDRIFVSTEGNAGIGAEIYELVRAASGAVSVELFFDVGSAIEQQSTGLNQSGFFAQGGLRGIAFHPDFTTNGKFYVSALVERPPTTDNYTYISDPTNPGDLDSLLAEFTYDAATGTVDPASYREVFRYGHFRRFNHPIKQIEFNPFAEPGDEDYGLLYISTGDGVVNGRTVSRNASQNNDALGKILRINPLQDGVNSYRVPATNPFVGSSNYLDEIWALGLRNGHNFSFNQTPDGETLLVLTEIGYFNFDEINIIAPGDNLGWGLREGHFIVDENGGNTTGLSPLPSNEADFGYRYPAAFIGHDAPIGTVGDIGQALAGGFVVNNGSELDGQFIFADFAESSRFYHVPFAELLDAKTALLPGESPSSLSWVTPSELTLLYNHDGDTETTPIVQASFKDIVDSFRSDVRFGQGPDGEVLITNKRDGWIYIVENSLPDDFTSPPVTIATYSGNTYQLGTPGLTWEQANAEAEALGGHLVTISDAAENGFVTTTFGGKNPIWLGLTDRDNEGTFVATTGKPVTYTNWLPGEPNNAGVGQDFVAIASAEGGWDDMPNTGGLFFNGTWQSGFTNLTVIEFEGVSELVLDAIDDQYAIKADESLFVTSAGSELGIIQNDSFTGDEPVITAVNGQPISPQGVSQFTGSNGGNFSLSPNGELTFDPGGDFDNLRVNQTATTSIDYTIQQQNGSSDTATVTITVSGVNPTGLTTDFDGDGHVDLFWQNIATGQTFIWLMQGVSPLQGNQLSTVPIDWRMAGTGDFDGNGSSDLVWRNIQSGENRLWLMEGTASILGVDLPTMPTPYELQAVADFNNDDSPDLFWRNPATQETVVWYMDGTSNIPNNILSLYPVPGEWSIEGVADFSGNGEADILWRNQLTGHNIFWLFDSATGISARHLLHVPGDWQISGVADFNLDGEIDLLWRNPSTGENLVWYMEGTSPLAAEPTMALPGSQWVLTV